jgi:hypothetical protein
MIIFQNILFCIYLSMLLWIILVGIKKYKTLLLPLRFMYWCVVLDFLTESIGAIVGYFGDNTEIYFSYSVIYLTLTLLFFNFSNPKFNFKISIPYWIVVPIVLIVALILFGQPHFQIGFISNIVVNGIVFLLSVYSLYIALKQPQRNKVYIGFYILNAIASIYDYALDSFFNLLIYIYKVLDLNNYVALHQLYLIPVYYIYYRLLYKDARFPKIAKPFQSKSK